ncbi:valyl-tRNA synthetase [Clostridium acetobutylicum]|uniref:Valine--tRNA ligase n=1 Tax=Clostridium acetobutylicum (strain ATCC 824 / DSM 792 / JCM 1419 / IAM 19013 / LMG 5710 / NBRC 13948 / NRRL B-527 / VKM B-1787 / 2291 / W) TaxID=272562 RepID=SYV_CLOAB|nr:MULTISPECIES: valine--tRNA ligase [Clostridium]Q97GG8.1 RecName: Full=Valine--tRNA ligase; AltName: Full=Valyl-tRNA synthetase; Short=ValRS [Clostridium acetobutylicum ATCC 824]AAK80354.1 Valyl-tRNA synthetase [Clostridium acetobutylicum ATCC 824]ADZ21451.1 valyl-tRNA synthetase [Clostridium acetobutylicum EA 2018]AEI33036.1 valyl-tRNA synthetase [Clostridium acetobutylicum DSM 1731]AWV79225.1 valine--tRNA ligase [Clostridium acetobutylicum]MBC2394808.1 valine--tRNA ligase [Clostridium ace
MKEFDEMAKTYDPKEFEDRIYKWWEEEGFFTPKVDKNKKPYTIMMPPPNITGKLHLGHALDCALQDFMIRAKRMQGYEALWLPGQDHASIATEVRVEKEILKEGLNKKEMGREKFLERVWDWTKEYRERIKGQQKKLGVSADFTRESFTMDEKLNKAVRTVFVKLYEDGLIYQGNRITNWCPKCQTALSDAEIEYKEDQGFFWHIKYPVEGEDSFIEIATTRPETMLGDTAVAVNPKDERYKEFIGKLLVLPLLGRKIPVVADDYVDMEFGTGAVKITPAHDPNDYEVGKRHDLKEIVMLNNDGTIKEGFGKYSGMDRYEARKAIVSDLKEEGYLVKIKEHVHNVGTHDRCGNIIEPMVSKQWYVKMESLAKPAIEAVKAGKTKFVPERFDKIYFNWMENIQDWCISRQLWWGHRIPVWYCKDCGEIIVSEKEPKACSKCNSENLEQDKDVLDTWFSSALWPFSTLGWPDKNEDLEYFYPTDTLVTGYDIIFFWVARMVFSGIYNMGEVPFKHVYIHGLVRDAEGRKMSKSLGNGVDPLDVIDTFGADALRFMLITGNAPGNDIRYKTEKVEAARNFANKIWNASRFVLMNLDKEIMDKYKDLEEYSLADRWILSRCNSLVREVTDNIEKFELGIASQKVYDFMWNEFCDWYIELVKPVMYGEDEKAKGIAYNVLYKVLTVGLQLLHPVMPYITEEIYQHLGGEYKAIAISAWPTYEEKLKNETSENAMNQIIEAIKSIRNVRAEMNVPPSKKAKVMIFTEAENKAAFEMGEHYFEKLAYASSVSFLKSKDEAPENAVSSVTKGAELFMPLLDLIDVTKEIERLSKEKDKLKAEIQRVDKKLSNKGFVDKAPESVVEAERVKGEKYKKMLEAVEERIAALK